MECCWPGSGGQSPVPCPLLTVTTTQLFRVGALAGCGLCLGQEGLSILDPDTSLFLWAGSSPDPGRERFAVLPSCLPAPLVSPGQLQGSPSQASLVPWGWGSLGAGREEPRQELLLPSPEPGWGAAWAGLFPLPWLGRVWPRPEAGVCLLPGGLALRGCRPPAPLR